MPDQPVYRSQVLDHLGLVAGMFDELGIGAVLDHATHHNPAMRDLTVGEAVKARGRNGLGCINQALYLVPRFFHNKPTDRLIAPCGAPDQRNEDALGRAWDTLYADGVTELYSLLAATAAEHLGRTPRFAQLDRPSCHVAGRDHSDEAPGEQVVHLTRGDSRDHRPDLNQVRWELMVEPQAGIPLRMQPRRGHSRDAHDCGAVVGAPVQPLPTTYGTPSLVAESALYRADNLPQLAQTRMRWITRVPATLSEAHAALAQVAPHTLASRTEGDRSGELRSTSGGMEPRWLLIYSESRQPPAPRPLDKQWRQHRAKDVTALKTWCGTTCACEAEARQALARFAQDWQATLLGPSTVRTRPRYGKRGRQATVPDQTGKRSHHPTARWVFHDVVGMHWLCQAGQWPIVLNLPADHQHLLRLLGQPYMRVYAVRYS